METTNCILYTDAGPNKWKKTVNHYGKLLRGSNGFCYAIADENGDLVARGVNRKAAYQIEGEAFAVLKTAEWIEENGEEGKTYTILCDNGTIAAMKPFKSKTAAGKYLFIAKKIIERCHVEIKVEWVKGEDNLADKYTKEEADLTETKKEI